MQRTLLHQIMEESLHGLARWAANPWRHLSLLAVVFTVAFLLGNGVPTVSGAQNLLDPVAAIAVMVVTELLVRQRPRLQRQSKRIWLHLLDALRLGFLYGVVLDGFRLMA